METSKVLRIISGTLKGKKLHPFHGKGIRPTSDRTRESIFNILSDRVPGAVVLDLFAGSGALGIEALSRGAGWTTFIDIAPAAVSLLKKNLRSCCLEEHARVIPWNIERNLNCLQSHDRLYNLIFLDPPYHKGMALTALTHLIKSQAITPGACLVLEHGEADKLPSPLTTFELLDQRKYGKTLVSFLRYMV
ncbi:MAG: 16S rRNA (guanine(966)-N(2))-methyltransferase RsmD [Desulfobacterales bacterium]|nr:16S rRNA (guanine(966)-N(2))-methyltransferase RsmD [Desulfobacterales bacterium]MDX2513157.1 16S rRNA (guanine(966)-N(2))-methyltransferase RsmD [Desulfobacterales bacterium]